MVIFHCHVWLPDGNSYMSCFAALCFREVRGGLDESTVHHHVSFDLHVLLWCLICNLLLDLLRGVPFLLLFLHWLAISLGPHRLLGWDAPSHEPRRVGFNNDVPQKVLMMHWNRCGKFDKKIKKWWVEMMIYKLAYKNPWTSSIHSMYIYIYPKHPRSSEYSPIFT